MFRVTSKLALSNLIKNRQLYIPFGLMTMVAVVLFYVCRSLAFNPTFEGHYGANALAMTLELGSRVLLIVAVFMLLYANSFVWKNRTKEFGLYSILGLGGKHLQLLTSVELFAFGTISVLSGLLLGIVLDKLAFATLVKFMRLEGNLHSVIQINVVITTLVVFASLFVVLLIWNNIRMLRLKPLELLRSQQKGEKKARFLGIQTIIALALLGYGYYTANQIENPMRVIETFFIAVLVVIAGTYILFDAGSITLLTWLKKRKGFYYQPQNMISVSNLIFRMRRNAAGLASICILSTMTMITLIAGTSVFRTAEQTRVAYPHQLGIVYTSRDGIMPEEHRKIFQEFDKSIQNIVTEKERFTTIALQQTEVAHNRITVQPQTHRVDFFSDTAITIISLEDYNRWAGENKTLADNEILLYQKQATLDPQQSVDIDGLQYHVKQEIPKVNGNFNIGIYDLNTLVKDVKTIVVKDLAPVKTRMIELLKEGKDSIHIGEYMGWDTSLSDAQTIDAVQQRLDASYLQPKLSKSIDDVHQDKPGYVFTSYVREEVVTRYYQAVGAIFFVAIVLAIGFMFSVFLVIYYKQISEGFEDRERFVILRKLGLSKKEVRKTINKQVLVVFFLPILFAISHVSGAYSILTKILVLLGVTNSNEVLQVALGVGVAFVLAYILVYKITSRSYEKIVSKK